MYLVTWWAAIEVLLFIFSLPFIRKMINKQEKCIGKRNLNSMSTVIDVIEKGIIELAVASIIITIVYAVLLCQSDVNLRELMEWYKGTFVVSFLPVLLSFAFDNKERLGSFWLILCLLLGVMLSVLGYKGISNIKIYIFVLALFTSTFIMSLWKACTKNSKQFIRVGKGIRKDLYNRTSSIDLNMNKIEIIRKAENYIERYLKKCDKMDGLCRIEFVTLLDI